MYHPSSSRVAARHLELTIQDYGPLNYWGYEGIGVGSKADPTMVERLRELGRKVKPRKLKILLRGMSLPSGTIRSSGYVGFYPNTKKWSTKPERHDEIKAPDGWVKDPSSGGWYLADTDAYRPYIRGVRSWTTIIRNAQYYARGGYRPNERTIPSSDGLILEWLNPPPSSIIVDTKPITDAGYKVNTDTGEVIADASSATIVGVRYDEKLGVVLTLTG